MKRQLRTEMEPPSLFKFAERRQRCGCHQFRSGIKVGGTPFGVCCLQGSPPSLDRIRCQLERLSEKRCRGGDPAALLRPCSSPFEFGSHRLIGACRSECAMPCATIGIFIWVDASGKGHVYPVTLVGVGAGIGHRPHEWMTKSHTRIDVDQVRRL